MMIERLDDYIEKLKKLRKLKEIKQNSDKQENIDKQYRTLVQAVHNLIHLLTYSNNNFHFTAGEQISALTDLLSKLKRCISTGFAEQDLVFEAQADFNRILGAVKRNWEKHYAILTKSTLGTLQVINKLDPELISSYQAKIQAGSVWPTEESTFIDLNEALSNSEKLIQSLNLDETVTVFLRKMASGHATILDLNTEVLCWIQSNALEGKIKLSFTAK